ncbi:MAG TPA: hydroxymethylbilane synthase [Ktedonobacteraceae bacterium]
MLQTQAVISLLRQQWPELDVQIEQIHTLGDRNTTMPLTAIGGDGVFVMEIERALLEGHIDLAVHSLKDLPTAQPAGLLTCVAGDREDARDVLVWNAERRGAGKPRPRSSLDSRFGNAEFASLRIGTCSLRRTAQLRAWLPGIEILPLRGNVDTRLRKLDAGEYDAIVLAAAGLHRLGAHERVAQRIDYLPFDVMLPAPGQGALALEIRDEEAMRELIAPLRNSPAEATTSAERMFMRRLGAGCYLPIAAYGEIRENRLSLQGLVISLDGEEQVRVESSIPWTTQATITDAERLGEELAELALAEGAASIIATVNEGRVREHASLD